MDKNSTVSAFGNSGLCAAAIWWLFSWNTAQHRAAAVQEGVSAAALRQERAGMDWALLQADCGNVYGIWLENKYKWVLSHLSFLVRCHFYNV